MKAVKQFEAKERVLGGSTFYIRPFSAFVAANISGELFSLILPILGTLAPTAAKAASASQANLLDIDAETAVPVLAQSLSGVGGDKLEQILKKLLVKHKNISVEVEGSNQAQPLTEDLANELFCGDAQDMFILAFDVIQANYTGFFKKAGALFGGQMDAFRELIQKKTPARKSTER